MDGAGNVIATGNFEGSTTFDSGTLSNPLGSDIYLVKYSPLESLSGRRLRHAIINVGERVTDVAVDGPGNIALTGKIVTDVNFGGGALVGTQSYDIFVAKFSGTGPISGRTVRGRVR